MPACQNSESPETGNIYIYTLKLPKRCGPLMVDPSPTSSTPSCLILLGSALQEKALKTLEKAKAKAMEKVPWKRLIFRDFRDLPWTKEFLDLPRISFCSSCWGFRFSGSQEMIPGYGMHEGSDHGNGSPIIGACENAMALRERMRLVVY